MQASGAKANTTPDPTPTPTRTPIPQPLRMQASGAKDKPTRRSVTWLVYLNSDWDATVDMSVLVVSHQAYVWHQAVVVRYVAGLPDQ